MTVKAGALACAAALAVTTAGGGAAAQSAPSQKPLTEAQVRSFFDGMKTQMTRWVNAGSADKVGGWLDKHTLDGAQFLYDTSTTVEERRVASSQGALGKDGLMKATSMLMGAGSPHGRIRDYKLEMTVNGVKLLSGGALAVVDADSRETGTIPRTKDAGAGSGGDQKDMQLTAAGQCRYFLVPGGSDTVQFATAICQVDIQL